MSTARLTCPDLVVRERRLEVTPGSLFAIEGGKGPTILCLHGVTANAFVWLPVMASLADRFRLVAIDQRGHGRSQSSGFTAWDADAYASDVAEVVLALEAGPTIVVGHSLGARNALVAGARFPRLVTGVIAIDFTPFIEPPVFDSLDTRVAGGLREFANLDEVRAYLVGRYPKLPAEAVERRAYGGYARSPDGLFRPIADPGAMTETCRGLRDDLSPATRALSVPALFVRGAESQVVSPAAFERTRRLRPDLPTVVVPGVDHYVPEEAPAVVAEIVGSLAQNAGGPHGRSSERTVPGRTREVVEGV